MNGFGRRTASRQHELRRLPEGDRASQAYLVHPDRHGPLSAGDLHPDSGDQRIGLRQRLRRPVQGHPWHVQHVLRRGGVAHGGVRPERDALHLGLYHRAAVGHHYPPWEKLRKEGGEAGRKQLNQYTRYLTVVLAVFQSFGIAVGLSNSPHVVDQPGIFFILSTVVTLTGGTMFLMWLGEQMTARGVGNGISLIIFAGIVARLPVGIWDLLQAARIDPSKSMLIFGYLAVAVVVILFIVFMERAQRRLLIVYPKRQVGNRIMGGENSFLPLKINVSGVIPPIFASSLILLPATAL